MMLASALSSPRVCPPGGQRRVTRQRHIALQLAALLQQDGTALRAQAAFDLTLRGQLRAAAQLEIPPLYRTAFQRNDAGIGAQKPPGLSPGGQRRVTRQRHIALQLAAPLKQSITGIHTQVAHDPTLRGKRGTFVQADLSLL
ncbi:hypothetical protein MA13_contig00019-0051 [Edwardsiella piscicida]|nr:hypothetical protein MA13_contig00019-0051 [Edwardsiella piscicida]